MNREAEFLRDQAAIAKIRLRLQASALADELLAPLRVSSLVRQKPWWSLGGALVGGFVGGLALRALTKSRLVRTAPARVKELVRNAPARFRQVFRAAPTRMRRMAGAVARDAHNVLVGALSILAAHLREGARPAAPPSANGDGNGHGNDQGNGHANGHSPPPSHR